MRRNEIILRNGDRFWIDIGDHYHAGSDRGLPSGTHSRAMVVGGILTIAIRMSEE